MIRYQWIIIGLFAGLIYSCDTAWDKHFDNNSEVEGAEVSNLNLLDYLKTQEDYSSFVQLLEETGIADELSRNQVLTVWAPDNESMATVSGLDSLSKVRLAKNHINYVALYNSKLANKTEIQSMEGKLLPLSRKSGVYYIDEHAVIRSNQVCQNGVVHGIEGVLVPQKNIYEYIMECGPDYSVFRDTLVAHNDTIFDPKASFPKGVDEVGNTIYDSVFVISNPYFEKGDPRKETSEFTMFIPNNEIMHAMLTDMTNYFVQIGREITTADTVKMMDWFLRSILHSGKITNYEASRDRKSVFGELWRTDKQLVETNYQECSNGLVYNISRFHVPTFMYLEKIVIYPSYIFYLPTEEQQNYYTINKGNSFTKNTWSESGKYEDGTSVGKKETAYFVICGDKETDKMVADAYVSFKSVTRDIYGNIDTTKVMPGIYKVCCSFRAYAMPKIDIFINDLLVAANVNVGPGGQNPRKGMDYVLPSNAGVEGARNGMVNDKFEIPESAGYHALDIKMVNSGKGYRIVPEWVILIPSDENY